MSTTVRVGDVITDPETIRRLQPGTRVRLRYHTGPEDVTLKELNDDLWIHDGASPRTFGVDSALAETGIEILALPEPAEQPSTDWLKPGAEVWHTEMWLRGRVVKMVDRFNYRLEWHRGGTYQADPNLLVPYANQDGQQSPQVPYVERDPDKLRVGMRVRNADGMEWSITGQTPDGRWKTSYGTAMVVDYILSGGITVVSLPSQPATEQPDLRTAGEALRDRVPYAPKPAVRQHDFSDPYRVRVDRHAGNGRKLHCRVCVCGVADDAGYPGRKDPCPGPGANPMHNHEAAMGQRTVMVDAHNLKAAALRRSSSTPLADAAMRAGDPMSYSGAGGITGALFNKKGRIA